MHQLAWEGISLFFRRSLYLFADLLSGFESTRKEHIFLLVIFIQLTYSPLLSLGDILRFIGWIFIA